MSDDAERLYERLLVLRCQSGDEDAYRELVERFSPRLRYFLVKMVGSEEPANDLLQEVWIDVVRQLPRLRDPAALVTWLYRIVRGKANLELRRKSRVLKIAADEELRIAPDDEPSFSADDAARVHLALDQLRDERREVLVLRFLEDMSCEDISRILGCPTGTVRSRIHYAKKALKQLLEPPEERR